jgi:hypothetical protein
MAASWGGVNLGECGGMSRLPARAVWGGGGGGLPSRVESKFLAEAGRARGWCDVEPSGPGARHECHPFVMSVTPQAGGE